VIFDENSSWDWSESSVAADTIALEWENTDQHEEFFATGDRANDAHNDVAAVVSVAATDFAAADEANNDFAADHRADSEHLEPHADPEESIDRRNLSNTRSNTFSASQ
jgi:hypothetical protein